MIPFTKAHACGNDFLIVTEEAAHGHNWADLTRRLCARNTGVGADGIEFFAWTGAEDPAAFGCTTPTAPLPKSAATARAAWRRGWRANAICKPGDDLEIATDAGVRVCRIERRSNTDGEFTVEVTTGMGVPTFAPQTVKLASGMEIAGVEVSTGNPHFVIVVDIDEFDAAGHVVARDRRGDLRASRIFRNQTNVEFVRIVSKHEIEIRIFERGVGPTTSSGTGSSASATAALALRAAFRRSRWWLPAARRPLPGTGPALSCGSPARQP